MRTPEILVRGSYASLVPINRIEILNSQRLAIDHGFSYSTNKSDLSGQMPNVMAPWRTKMQSWQMQTAKARFSEVVKNAADEGPQEITVHGRPVAVIISPELFDRLSGNQNSLVDFMRQSPLYGREEITFERDRSLPREVDL